LWKHVRLSNSFFYHAIIDIVSVLFYRAVFYSSFLTRVSVLIWLTLFHFIQKSNKVLIFLNQKWCLRLFLQFTFVEMNLIVQFQYLINVSDKIENYSSPYFVSTLIIWFTTFRFYLLPSLFGCLVYLNIIFIFHGILMNALPAEVELLLFYI